LFTIFEATKLEEMKKKEEDLQIGSSNNEGKRRENGVEKLK
jgi:hypothetical protein